MMKKLCIFMACIMACAILSACEKRDEEKATDTTPLTLTESLTTEVTFEPEPVEQQKPVPIKFAIFNPFDDSEKLTENTRRELIEAINRIDIARAVLRANHSHGGLTEYYDESRILETDETGECVYYALKPEFAETKEDLTAYLRNYFTEDYLSDEGLEAELFEQDERGEPVRYKEIDGTLCMRNKYVGILPTFVQSEFLSVEYEGNRVKFSAVYSDGGWPSGTMGKAEMVKSEEYGWRLDKLEILNYYGVYANEAYNAVVLRADTLNEILGGGETPENPAKITVDGVAYTETALDMSIDEMEDFFTETFAVHSSGVNPDISALQRTYKRTYIEEVYAEQDGILYRRDDAPVWYLPQAEVDVTKRAVIFHDHVTGETFEQEIEFETETIWDEETREDVYYKLRISSELPIREYAEKTEKIKLEKFDSPEVGAADAELVSAVEKIVDGHSILTGDLGIEGEWNEKYIDGENMLEETEKFNYCAVKPELAGNEEELAAKIRSIFTENYISDEEVRERLFTDNYEEPIYKTIDGVLCYSDGYRGAFVIIYTDRILSLSRDGDRASAVVYGTGVDYEAHVYIDMVYSEEYGWRADSIEIRAYSEDVAILFHNAFTLKRDTINAILGGGTVPENAKRIDIDGEGWTETDTGMSLEEMQDFFAETFCDYKEENEYAERTKTVHLRDEYIQKYITDVYAERDGILYRKDGAPKWYLPEMKNDIYYGRISSYSADEGRRECIRREYFDDLTGEWVEVLIALTVSDDYYSDSEKLECEHLYISSELPIKVLE